MTKQQIYRISIIVSMLALTLSLHYMIIPAPHWIHLFHRRLCYFPIILGGIWFGLTGGLAVAVALSLAVLPLALQVPGPLLGNEELVEILFYLGIALLTGVLVQKGERARQQKEEAERELVSSERLALTGRTAAGIAHEVRTPLGAILGVSEIFAEDFPKEHPHWKFFAILQKESRRLEKVIEDFLDLSRSIVIEPIRTELAVLFDECLDSVREAAAARSVTLQRRIPGDLWIEVDPHRLHQAVVNLLLNAVQHSPEQGNVYLIGSASLAGWVSIRVEDEGPGIPEEERARIFEPFFTKRKDGTGLGLSLARQIALAHGGEIVPENRPGGGASFEIRLPIRRPSSA